MKTIQQVQYWRDPLIGGVETSYVCRSRHVFPEHWHDDLYAIGLMESGASFCQGPAKKDSLVFPGSLALINPGQIHSGVPANNDSISYRMLYVDTARMCELAADIFHTGTVYPEFKRMAVYDPPLAQLLGGLCRLIVEHPSELKKEGALFEVMARLLSAYGRIAKPSTPYRVTSRIIRQAQDCLSENLDRKMALSEVACAVGMSRYHFLREFKRATGLSPHRFRTQRRLEQAKALMHRGMPFAQVALETGFVDQSHLTKKFKQFYGATPGQYLSMGRS